MKCESPVALEILAEKGLRGGCSEQAMEAQYVFYLAQGRFGGTLSACVARPAVSALHAAAHGRNWLPKSPWCQVVHYSLARWDKLTRYTEDGHIEIDNNLCENAIRPIALGRKNYLFAGSHDAAQRAAVIYSVLATCKKRDV